MSVFKKLPDSELELMKIIWANNPPMSTNEIIEKLDEDNNWKPPTVLTLLMRLVNKDFLKSERKGKERIYCPIVNEQEYFQFETVNFIKKFHQNSLASLVNTLYDGKQLSDRDIEQLSNFLREKGGNISGKVD